MSSATREHRIIDQPENELVLPHRRSRRAELARGIGVKTPLYRQPWVILAFIVTVVAVLFGLAS